MSIKIRVLQFKRGLLDRLMAAGILPGEPAIAWDDDTKPRLLIGDRMGVPRELAAPAHVHLISSITGLQAALDTKAWGGGGIAWSQLTDIPGVAAFTNDAGYLTGITNVMVTAALGFTPAHAIHGHAIADVDGLQDSLVSKADLVAGKVPVSQLPIITPSRTMASATTASLAPGATAQVSVPLAKTAEILTVAADHPAEVRLYNTSAARDADASRASVTWPDAGKGLVCQSTFPQAGTGAMSINQDPGPRFANQDVPVGTTAYLSVTNTGAVAVEITVSITYLPQE